MVNFEFTGLHDYRSVCGVDIYYSPDAPVVVLTELPENPGTSVTNAWPSVADQILKHFYDSNPREIVWIEHYLPRGDRKESWDLVHLRWVEEDRHFQMLINRHPWESLTEVQFQAMIEDLAKIV